jgi:hypothetical protein
MLRLHNLSKLTFLIVMLSAFTLSAQTYQGTVSITSTGSTIEINEGLNTRIIPASDIYAQKYGNQLYGDKIAINNGAIEVIKWTFRDYLFIVSGDTIPTIDSLQTRINNLNSGTIPKMQLLTTIKVVASLPAIPEPNTDYVVGDTGLINITGLNGNNSKLWQIVINGVAKSTATTTLELQMIINGITTAGAYTSTNQNIAQGGVVSVQNSATHLLIGAISVVNTSADVHFSSNVFLSPPVVSASTFRTMSAMGSYARNTSVYGHSNSGGIWRDASTNITSIQITNNSTATTKFTIGTEIQILQLPK